jgi:hypothetical protein
MAGESGGMDQAGPDSEKKRRDNLMTNATNSSSNAFNHGCQCVYRKVHLEFTSELKYTQILR